MAIQRPPGYFIVGAGYGGAHGPKSKASETAYLHYGPPVVGEFQGPTVRPIEKAFELLRYCDPTLQREIYIARFEPNTLGLDDNAIAVPATPELNMVFDDRLPLWDMERKYYHRRCWYAVRRAIAKAGLTDADMPVWPGDEPGEEAKHTYDEGYRHFWELVRPLIRPPKPLLIEVLDIDGVLEGIELTPLPPLTRGKQDTEVQLRVELELPPARIATKRHS